MLRLCYHWLIWFVSSFLRRVAGAMVWTQNETLVIGNGNGQRQLAMAWSAAVTCPCLGQDYCRCVGDCRGWLTDGGATEDNIVVLSVLKTGTRYIVPTGFTGLISGLVLVGHTQAWDQWLYPGMGPMRLICAGLIEGKSYKYWFSNQNVPTHSMENHTSPFITECQIAHRLYQAP